jgi:uncharacterized RmlC-like cupin family protein
MGKYDQYFIGSDKLIKKGHFVNSIFSGYDNLGADIIVNYHFMTGPMLMVPKPHSHGCYELLCFIGGTGMDISEFGGEVELCMGEEQEKHIINSTCIVAVPPGVPHCPINFKTVTKPFYFMVILMAGKYTILPEEPVSVAVEK